MRLMWILSIVLVSLCVSPLCVAQVGELQAKLFADAAARKHLDFPESKPLRVHRREDLEDDLFSFQRNIRGKIAKFAYFYEITGDGQFVISPDEAIVVTSSHGERKWLVAISAKDGQNYMLYGFTDAAAAFNNLATDAFLEVDNVTKAEVYSYFYYKLVNDLLGKRLLFNPRHLRHEVENYYFFHYPDAKAESLYKAWLKNYSSTKQSFKFGADAQRESEGYIITLTSLGSLNKNPQLKLWTLRISVNGTILETNTRPIYPR